MRDAPSAVGAAADAPQSAGQDGAAGRLESYHDLEQQYWRDEAKAALKIGAAAVTKSRVVVEFPVPAKVVP